MGPSGRKPAILPGRPLFAQTIYGRTNLNNTAENSLRTNSGLAPKFRIFVALCMAMLALECSSAMSAPVGACLTVINVKPFDVLYIREKPDYRSSKVGAIAPDSESPIVVTGRCTPAGAGPRKLWCPIKYYVTKDATRSGYVKMYFTKEIPCPPSLKFYQN